MDLGIVSTRYAKALLLFAEQNNEEDRVYEETSVLAETFIQIPALQQAMINPVLTEAQKKQLLLTAACGKNAPSQSLSRFASLIIQKMRAELMHQVALTYGTLYRKGKHSLTANLCCPQPSTSSSLKSCNKWLKNGRSAKLTSMLKKMPLFWVALFWNTTLTV